MNLRRAYPSRSEGIEPTTSPLLAIPVVSLHWLRLPHMLYFIPWVVFLLVVILAVPITAWLEKRKLQETQEPLESHPEDTQESNEGAAGEGAGGAETSDGTVCYCDSTSQPLQAHEVYAISPEGGLPTDPSPEASGGAKVYRLLCKEKFISLYEDHGFSATDEALAESQRIAQEHLRLTNRL